jgi:hypothetical protein
MHAEVRCPVRRHLLADIDSAGQDRWLVKPRQIKVYDGDDRHRKSLTTEGLRSAEWLLTDEVPETIDVLVCACNEFFYPDDLAAQIRARRRVILATPL